MLLEFPSVVDAVEYAVAVQTVMAERNDGIPQDKRMLFRIGINLGDILIQGDDRADALASNPPRSSVPRRPIAGLR